MSTRYFQIALVDRVARYKLDYFDYRAKNEITYTLWDHLARIAPQTAGGFIPAPSWSIRSSELSPWDVVVYFVLEEFRGVARSVGRRGNEGPNGGGAAVPTSHGVICEVYVEGNMPARRLANIAFHELMHCKLDVGTSVLNDLHTQGGGGLAVPPTGEWTPLTNESIAILAPHMMTPVKQYTGSM